MVGGETRTGSTLPAMLGGHSRRSGELDSRAVLGWTRLPCPGRTDDGLARLAGRIRIDVAANAAERKAWAPWLEAVLSEMVPLTARASLRWVSAQSLQSDRLDGTLTLDGPPAPHLGAGAITNLARLPERPVRLSASAPTLSTRLW
jgi:hypothetical protein